MVTQAPMILYPPAMTDDEFYEFCQRFPTSGVERTARGEIVVTRSGGLETGFRNCDLGAQLGNWAAKDGRGKSFGSNTEYILPSGAASAPDASWVANTRIAKLTANQKRKFPRLCPDFVIELTSPSDRLRAVQRKMGEWIENGAQLGWLLHADRRTAYVYRPGKDPEKLVDPARLKGQGPVAGFVLELSNIWGNL